MMIKLNENLILTFEEKHVKWTYHVPTPEKFIGAVKEVLSARLESGHWYFAGQDDQYVQKVEQFLSRAESQSPVDLVQEAYNLLLERRDYEYEGFSLDTMKSSAILEE